jgi:hypothetical protein
MQEPSQSDLQGCRAQCRSDLAQGARLDGGEAPEREERNIRDSFAGELIEQMIVRAVNQVVVVLNADLGHLCGGDIAQAQVAYQALALQFRAPSWTFSKRAVQARPGNRALVRHGLGL